MLVLSQNIKGYEGFRVGVEDFQPFQKVEVRSLNQRSDLNQKSKRETERK